VFLVAGRQLLLISVGAEYADAFYPLLVYLVGVGLSMMSFAYQPAMLALGKAEEAFGILLWSTALYLTLLVFMTSQWGVIGACASYVLFYCVWTAWMYRGVKRGIREWQRVGP
jgi:O-antigen/teichoic acid export membrane protein